MEDDGIVDVVECVWEVMCVCVLMFVECGWELLVIECVREMEMVAETVVDCEDVEDVDDELFGFVFEELSEFGVVVFGLCLVGVMCGLDGKVLVVLCVVDGEVIAVNLFIVGDRVTISAYGDEFASADEFVDGSVVMFLSEVMVWFMGDVLNVMVKGCYGDVLLILLEYVDDE